MSPDLFLFLLGVVSFTAYKLGSMPYCPEDSALGPPDFGDGTGSAGLNEDATSLHHSFADSDPAFNIDGSVMLGAFDMNENAYAFSQSNGNFIDHGSTGHTAFEAVRFEHIVNIDGTPMCGDIDIHGNLYGVTDWHTDSWDCGMSSSSMFD